jgi:hypothetical protein
MIAIETRLLPSTNYKPSRLVATTANGQRLVMSAHHDTLTESDERNHRRAAEALRDKMGWKGELIAGGTKAGYAFVFVS